MGERADGLSPPGIRWLLSIAKVAFQKATLRGWSERMDYHHLIPAGGSPWWSERMDYDHLVLGGGIALLRLLFKSNLKRMERADGLPPFDTRWWLSIAQVAFQKVTLRGWSDRIDSHHLIPGGGSPWWSERMDYDHLVPGGGIALLRLLF